MRTFAYIILLLLIISCGNTEAEKTRKLIEKWFGKEIFYPENVSFESYSREYGDRKMNLVKGDYSILFYIDSVDCMSCKLRLDKWGELIHVVDSVSDGRTPFVFVFQSKRKEDMIHFLKRSGFEYPVFIDTEGLFNRLNNLPDNDVFHNFLLDKNNRIVAIGNPVDNPYVRQLYLDIIQGKEIGRESDRKKELTHVTVADTAVATLPDFSYQEEQHGRFALVNTGDSRLVIQQVTTTCGCLETDYSQAPVLPGDTVCLNYSYKADYPGYFDKVLYVYCNAEESPLRLRVRGTAMD